MLRERSHWPCWVALAISAICSSLWVRALRGFGRSEWCEDGYWFADYLGDLDALVRSTVNDYAVHHRTLDEMILEQQLPRVGEPMVKIVARHPEVPSRELYRLAVEAGVDGVELTHSGAPYVEMAATGVSSPAR